MSTLALASKHRNTLGLIALGVLVFLFGDPHATPMVAGFLGFGKSKKEKEDEEARRRNDELHRQNAERFRTEGRFSTAVAPGTAWRNLANKGGGVNPATGVQGNYTPPGGWNAWKGDAGAAQQARLQRVATVTQGLQQQARENFHKLVFETPETELQKPENTYKALEILTGRQGGNLSGKPDEDAKYLRTLVGTGFNVGSVIRQKFVDSPEAPNLEADRQKFAQQKQQGLISPEDEKKLQDDLNRRADQWYANYAGKFVERLQGDPNRDINAVKNQIVATPGAAAGVSQVAAPDPDVANFIRSTNLNREAQDQLDEAYRQQQETAESAAKKIENRFKLPGMAGGAQDLLLGNLRRFASGIYGQFEGLSAGKRIDETNKQIDALWSEYEKQKAAGNSDAALKAYGEANQLAMRAAPDVVKASQASPEAGKQLNQLAPWAALDSVGAGFLLKTVGKGVASGALKGTLQNIAKNPAELGLQQVKNLAKVEAAGITGGAVFGGGTALLTGQPVGQGAEMGAKAGALYAPAYVRGVKPKPPSTPTVNLLGDQAVQMQAIKEQKMDALGVLLGIKGKPSANPALDALQGKALPEGATPAALPSGRTPLALPDPANRLPVLSQESAAFGPREGTGGLPGVPMRTGAARPAEADPMAQNTLRALIGGVEKQGRSADQAALKEQLMPAHINRQARKAYGGVMPKGDAYTDMFGGKRATRTEVGELPGPNPKTQQPGYREGITVENLDPKRQATVGRGDWAAEAPKIAVGLNDGKVIPVGGTFRQFLQTLEKASGGANRTYRYMVNSIWNPYKKADATRAMDEAGLNKELRTVTKTAGIKRNSPESADLQAFGEGRLTEADLTNRYGADKAAKIQGVEQWMRAKYDELIIRIQDAQRASGMDSSEIIQPRDNYFHHFQELGEGKAGAFGVEGAGEAQIRTAITKQRKGNQFKDDAVGGFERYIPQAMREIHLRDTVERLNILERALTEQGKTNLAKAVRDKVRRISGDLSLEAGSFAGGLNKLTNRAPGYGAWSEAQATVAANQILGNQRVSAIQVFQGFIESVSRAGVLNTANGLIKEIASYAPKAMRDKGMAPARVTEWSPFVQARHTNTRKGQGSIFEKTRRGLANVSIRPADRFAMGVLTRSMRRKAEKAGFKDEAAILEADRRSALGVGDRSALAQPEGFQGMMGVATKYGYEPFNQLYNIIRTRGFDPLYDKNPTRAKLRMARELTALFAVSYAANEAMTKATGNKVFFDPARAVQESYEMAKSGNKLGAVGRLVGEVGGNLPFATMATDVALDEETKRKMFGRTQLGFYGTGIPALAPVDTTRRVIGDLGKHPDKKGDILLTGAADIASQILPTGGGGQIKKTIEGGMSLGKPYKTKSGAELPITIGSDPVNTVRALLFGKGATREVQEYFKQSGITGRSADSAEKTGQLRNMFSILNNQINQEGAGLGQKLNVSDAAADALAQMGRMEMNNETGQKELYLEGNRSEMFNKIDERYGKDSKKSRDAKMAFDMLAAAQQGIYPESIQAKKLEDKRQKGEVTGAKAYVDMRKLRDAIIDRSISGTGLASQDEFTDFKSMSEDDRAAYWEQLANSQDPGERQKAQDLMAQWQKWLGEAGAPSEYGGPRSNLSSAPERWMQQVDLNKFDVIKGFSEETRDLAGMNTFQRGLMVGQNPAHFTNDLEAALNLIGQKGARQVISPSTQKSQTKAISKLLGGNFGSGGGGGGGRKSGGRKRSGGGGKRGGTTMRAKAIPKGKKGRKASTKGTKSNSAYLNSLLNPKPRRKKSKKLTGIF